MNYSNLAELISDNKRIKFGQDIEEKYLTDGLKREKGNADVLVFPTSTQEVSSIMKFAYRNSGNNN